MSGHTRGPWLTKEQVATLNERHGWFQYGDAQGDVSRAFANDAVAMHERIRAAAPEMLEVLKVYAEFDNCSNVDDRGTCTPERQCICCRARAAAAKAEGRQP